jgi:hypothetical protein
MTLYFSGGALKIAKPDGTIKFDSDDGLFHGTDIVNDTTYGTIALSSYQAQTTNTSGTMTYPALVDAQTDQLVASVSASATHLVGFMRTAWSSGSPEFDGIWRDASGTQIDSWDGLNTSAAPGVSDPDYHFYMGSMSLLTFYVTGGQLRFRERIVLRADNPPTGRTNTQTRPAITVYYRLLAGFFL